jgi:drug/metabolite transporter (DMT)-like permease
MSPITAILLGIAALGERLTMAQLGGMALVAVGLAVLDGRPVAWIRSKGAR